MPLAWLWTSATALFRGRVRAGCFVQHDSGQSRGSRPEESSAVHRAAIRPWEGPVIGGRIHCQPPSCRRPALSISDCVCEAT